MPWKETHVETERRRFVEEYFAVGRRWSMTELCEAFGVSRKTGYKWIGRFQWSPLEPFGVGPRQVPENTPQKSSLPA